MLIGLNLAVTRLMLARGAAPTAGFPSGWTHRAPIVIQQSRIDNASTLTNFPVLLIADCLPDDFKNSGLFQAEGGDIRFSSDEAGETPIPCEIVSFSGHAAPASARCEIWVKVPRVSPRVDTTFYMWRKSGTGQMQPAVDHAAGRNAVWADYLCVFHGDDLTDATGNGNDLTARGGATAGSATARIGKAFNLARASSQYFSAGSAAMLDNLLPLTVQCWARNTEDGYAAIIAKQRPTGDAPWSIWATGETIDGGLGWGFYAPGEGYIHGRGGETPLNEWRMLAGGAGGSGATSAFRWTDGVGNSFDRLAAPQDDSAANLMIGYSGGGGGGLGYYNGQIDEVRLRAEFLGSDWMQADYETQANPALFAIGGAVTRL